MGKEEEGRELLATSSCPDSHTPEHSKAGVGQSYSFPSLPLLGGKGEGSHRADGVLLAFVFLVPREREPRPGFLFFFWLQGALAAGGFGQCVRRCEKTSAG